MLQYLGRDRADRIPGRPDHPRRSRPTLRALPERCTNTPPPAGDPALPWTWSGWGPSVHSRRAACGALRRPDPTVAGRPATHPPGLNQREAADLSGMSQPRISRIERGEVVPEPADVESSATCTERRRARPPTRRLPAPQGRGSPRHHAVQPSGHEPAERDQPLITGDLDPAGTHFPLGLPLPLNGPVSRR
ncbi:helix-turn-helix domain-containing protein [Spirillospora sp. CA-255316]